MPHFAERRLSASVNPRDSMPTAVLFDLYGTLLHLAQDSRPFVQLAVRAARERSQISVRTALNLALTTENSTLTQYAARLGLGAQADVSQLETALRSDLDSVQIFADVRTTLSELKHRGILTALISNLSTPYRLPVEAHDLGQLFDVCTFSCECGFRKPASEIYDLTLQSLGVTPADALMVGDSLTADVTGPSRLGIDALLLVRGSTAPPDAISSLVEVLDRLPSP